MASKIKGIYELLTDRFYKRDEKGIEVAYRKGDSVPLTENEYAAFKDKFGAEAKGPASKAAVKPAGSLPDPNAKVEVAQETAKAPAAPGSQGAAAK